MNCVLTTGCIVHDEMSIRPCAESCWAGRSSPSVQQHLAEANSAPIDSGITFNIPVEKGHYVYSHLNAAGDVLYVGRTASPLGRTLQHRDSRGSWWFPLVVDIRWTRYEFRSAAEHNERRLIAKLKPPHNTLGTGRRSRTITHKTRAQA